MSTSRAVPGSRRAVRWLRKHSWRTTTVIVGSVAVGAYLTGWGSLLGVVFVLLAALLLRASGSRVWRSVLALVALVGGCGQLLIAAGRIPTYLPQTVAQAAGILGTVIAGLTVWVVGRGLENVERKRDWFQALANDANDVLVVRDRKGRLTYVSDAVEHVMGYRPQDYLAIEDADLIHPDDLPALMALGDAIIDGTGQDRAEVRVRHADGSWHRHEVSGRNLLANPAVKALVYQHRDITDRADDDERDAQGAVHDALTDLAGRPALLSALETLCTGPSPEPVVLLCLGLDGVEQINNEFGRAVGDELVMAAARLIRHSLFGGDTVYRIGDDEFAIVLSGVQTVENAVVVAERLIGRLSGPIPVRDQLIETGANVGIAMCPVGKINATEVVRRADVAMYRARGSNNQRWQLFVEGMQDQRAAGTKSLEDDLRRALDNGQLRVAYQPIFDLTNDQITGVEALVRWQHPTYGWLSRPTFLSLAEETGLITQLGTLMMRQSCVQLKRWHDRYPNLRRLTLSVNLSPRQLEHPTLLADIHEVLYETELSPEDLILEIPEPALAGRPIVVEKLRELRDYGIRIAVDDFGTGVSSLRHLTSLPISIIKIDRCFVETLDGTAENAAVADAVIRLGSALQLDVIAEGVETASQADELRSRGCGAAQGFHFSRPVDPAKIEVMLDRAARVASRLSSVDQRFGADALYRRAASFDDVVA